MCGIAGFLNVHDEDLLRRMSYRIRHRGPDSSGVAHFPAAGLAHQRLSIIDLSETGNQPMWSADRRYAIIYNGEVYNFGDLRKKLEQRGVRFRGMSDTEVILEYFVKYGVGGLKDLNGMFGFAIYDSHEHRMWLARDRFGIKPLYYLCHGDRLYFASEIKALLEIPEIALTVDEIALFAYLRFQYIPSPRTIYREIKKLPPGHILAAADGAMTIDRYVDLETDDAQDISEEEAIRRTDHLLDASIKKHLIADVPVGLFLSGGLDSSVMAAMAVRHVSELNTFSIVFANAPKEDERPYSRQVADLLKTRHHEFEIQPGMGEEMLADVVYHLDEPMGDPAVLPTYLLAKETAKHIKVVLKGEGADELFGGYKQYFIDRLVDNPLARWGAQALRRTGRDRRTNNLRRLLRAVASKEPAHRRQEYAAVFSNEDLLRLLPGSPYRAPYFLPMPVPDGLGLNGWLVDDMRYWLVDDLLMKADKMMMRFSLEGRVPFLENDLHAFVSGLPPRMKVRRWSGKWVLRKVAENYLPHEIIYRQKHGFNVPLREWFRGPLSKFLKSELLSLSRIPWMDTQEVDRMFELHLSGREDHARQLYLLLNLALWFDQNASRITFES